MNTWLAISISLILAVVTIYLLAIEIFSVAFKLTGLATNKIKLQVASLFTGTGFTTAESELITNNEKRRKIALACIYTGHIFSVAFMGLIINIVFSLRNLFESELSTPNFTEWFFIVLYITAALFVLMLILKIPPINKKFQKFLEAIAINSTKNKRSVNYVTVLDLYGKHAIVEVILNNIPEFAKDVPLCEMNLTKKYQVNVLSIKRGKRVIDVTKDTMFHKGDVLVIYGIISDINDAFVNSVTPNDKVSESEHVNEINLINNYGGNSLVEVYVDEVPEELKDKKISETNIKEKYNITIGVLKRKDEYIFIDKDTVVQKGDTLSLFGPYRNIKILFKNDEN